jgi:hypothetical protein
MHERTDVCMFCTEGSGRNGLVRACLYTKMQARSETGVLPRVRGTRAAGWSGTSRSYPSRRGDQTYHGSLPRSASAFSLRFAGGG